MKLSSKQRAFLKKKGNRLDAIVRVGKDGVTDNLIKSLSDSLTAREFVKVKILENCEDDKRDIAEELTKKTESELVHILGRTLLIFRENPKKPIISNELKEI